MQMEKFMTVTEEDTTPIEITPEITPQGVLIPREAVQEWLEEGIEIIKNRGRIVIQPQIETHSERERVLEVLKTSGTLVKLKSKPIPYPVTSVELEELREKFSVGQPLSEIVIKEREERW
jgi:hypothetical protein